MNFRCGSRTDKAQYIHHCQIEEYGDAIPPLPHNASCHTRINRFLLLATIIWKNHAYTGQYYKSNNAVEAEIVRQIIFNRTSCIIHPFSKFWFIWCAFMSIVFYFSFLCSSYNSTFVTIQEIHYTDIIILVCNFMLFAHMIIECHVGYIDENTRKIILNKQQIRKRYIRNHLLFDLISLFPLHLIMRLMKHPCYLPGIIGLARLKRYGSMVDYYNVIYMNMNLNDRNKNWFIHGVSMLAFIHYCGCAMFYIPMLKHEFSSGLTKLSWIIQQELFDLKTNVSSEPPHIQYYVCFSLALTSLLGCGGIIEYKTYEDILVWAFLQVLMYFFYAYCLVRGVGSFMLAKSSETKYQEIMCQLEEYMGHNQLPEDLQDRIRRYYVYRFQKRYFNDKSIMELLSRNMRQEIIVTCCSRMVQSVEILKNLPKNVLDEIFRCMRHEVFLPNDIIAKAGTQGNCMYFLASGTVTIVTPTGKEVTHLEDGAHIGEIALLVADMKRVANVIAIEICDVYRLDRKDFKRCVALSTDLQYRMVHIAKGRMDITQEMEEAHKKIMKAVP